MIKKVIEKHESFVSDILNTKSAEDFICVYHRSKQQNKDINVFSGLVPSNIVSERLQHKSWDIGYGEGLPVTGYYSGELKYLRYGTDDGVEPFVLVRKFNGIKKEYLEINEEFRLFHNLYHDRQKDEYIKIDDDGIEHKVIKVTGKEEKIEVRQKEIREFLALKGMHFSIMFDNRQQFNQKVTALGIKEGIYKEEHESTYRYYISFGNNLLSVGSYSRMCGKVYVAPFPKDKSGKWGFTEKIKKYENFLIGKDEFGENIESTCNPEQLGDNFGNNPDAFNYFTPISFKKDVLQKYLSESSKYSVSDGYLSCGDLWSVHIDNDHDEHVMVWLGDLGKEMPHVEQLHWKNHNIYKKKSVSPTVINRHFMVQATDPEQLDLKFKHEYNRLMNTFNENPLLKALNDEDFYLLKTLFIPASQQKDFDGFVTALTKILIDSINEKELEKYIPEEHKRNNMKGITKLDVVFKHFKIDAKDTVFFLRDLQNLRSSSSAHRKGTKYKSISEKLKIDYKGFQKSAEEMLVKAIEYINKLQQLNSKINKSKQQR